MESISKIGHWKIKLPEFAFELSDEIYNIFEMEKKGVELSFDNFLEFIHPTDRVAVKKTLQNALHKKSKIQVESKKGERTKFTILFNTAN